MIEARKLTDHIIDENDKTKHWIWDDLSHQSLVDKFDEISELVKREDYDEATKKCNYLYNMVKDLEQRVANLQGMLEIVRSTK